MDRHGALGSGPQNFTNTVLLYTQKGLVRKHAAVCKTPHYLSGARMWNLKIIDTNKSLYIALADALERDIRAGVLQPGDRLPSHRDLAKSVGVTVTTVTRAYAEAEKRNLITAMVGMGTFVAADAGVAASLVDTSAQSVKAVNMGLVHPLHGSEQYLEEVVQRVLARGGLHRFVPYAFPQGHHAHRETGARWVGRFGVNATAESVVVTAGTQHALHCIFSTLFEPGDRVAVEKYTYPGVKSAARANCIRLEAVEMDTQGMLPESLDALCQRQNIKGLYTAGLVQNPTNSSMGPQRRQALGEVIQRHGLLLLEDGVDAFLAEGDSRTLSALLPEQSIFICGMAQAFYTGLRIAFVVAPRAMCVSIAQGVVDSIWMTPPLCAEIICETINSGIADKIITQKKDELDKRMSLFKQRLRGYSFVLEQRSMHVWLELPHGWTSTAFEQAAQRVGLQVYSSEKFTVGHMPPPNCVRLAISSPQTMQTFRQGLDLLVRVLEGGCTT